MSGPTFHRIARQLADDIRSGQYRPGDKLPPHRILADELGVAIATVSRAYAELSRIGLTSGERGRGTFVRRSPYEPTIEAIPDSEVSGEIDLSINQPALSSIHDRKFTSILTDLTEREAILARANIMAYQPSTGLLRHRIAAARWLDALRVSVKPEAIVIAGGIQQAVMISCVTAFRPGDVVLTEALTNPSFRALASILRLRIVGVAMDREGLVPDALDRTCQERGATGLYCMPSLQNPTGTLMSETRRADIAEVTARHNLTVIENAAYDPLLATPSKPLRAFLKAHGIASFYISALSKVVSPGLRIAYAIPPDDLAPQLASAVFATTTVAPQMLAEIASRWITDGTARELVAWQRQEAAARRDIAAAHLGEMVDLTTAPCNHLWLPLPDPWRADQIITLAHHRGLRLASPETFSVGRAPTPQAIRLSLGAARDRTTLAKGVEALADILEGAPLLPYSLV